MITPALLVFGSLTNASIGVSVQAYSAVLDALAAQTDLPVADGGTGASNASGARTNLGLVIGTNVQAYSETLAVFASAPSAGDVVSLASGNEATINFGFIHVTFADVTATSIVTGTIKATALPSADPVEAGAIWNDSGFLKVSAGT